MFIPHRGGTMRRLTRPVGTRSFVEALESRRLLSFTPFISLGASPSLIGTVPVGTSSSQGVTLQEKAGVQFTASVGTFLTTEPQSKLVASIAWGDGTTSKGLIKALPNAGIVPLYEVDGTHTYKNPGTYVIKVLVVEPAPTPTASTTIGSPIKLIASWYSRAIVAGKNVLLDGTVQGTYSLAPTAFTLGAGYVFNGSGTAGDLGNVNARGFVIVPGIYPDNTTVTGRAFGTLTLTQVSPLANAVVNSVTLSLIGPPQAATDGFPSTLSYRITSGTGTFAGATGTGTIAVTLNKADGTFTFVLTSITPVV
jgi:hypothetical protein